MRLRCQPLLSLAEWRPSGWRGEKPWSAIFPSWLEDPPRPEVPDAMRRCHEAGIKVIMITGDHPQTARAIGRQIGLLQTALPRIVTGSQMQRLSNAQLQLALEAPEILFARVSADQKMRIVKALKAKNHIVAVSGDGVNDAPALRHADIGIAMGSSGTYVARESADLVLLDDNFATIVAAVEVGRAVFSNIRNFLTYILTSNVPELIPYLALVLFKVPLGLTILQILVVDLGTDLLPALGLGIEKNDPDAMKRPPRLRQDRLLDWPLVFRSYGFLGLWESVGEMSVFLIGGSTIHDLIDAAIASVYRTRSCQFRTRYLSFQFLANDHLPTQGTPNSIFALCKRFCNFLIWKVMRSKIWSAFALEANRASAWHVKCEG